MNNNNNHNRIRIVDVINRRRTEEVIGVFEDGVERDEIKNFAREMSVFGYRSLIINERTKTFSFVRYID